MLQTTTPIFRKIHAFILREILTQKFKYREKCELFEVFHHPVGKALYNRIEGYRIRPFSEIRWTISLKICRSFNHDATNNHTDFQKKSYVHFTRNLHSKIQIIEKNGNFLRVFHHPCRKSVYIGSKDTECGRSLRCVKRFR